ncbi:dihydrofolate reductase family protein [Nocardioides pyridinolyticus]
MRVLVGTPDADLATLYAPLADPWLRVNMVATVDGSATGESGRSGSINNEPDHVVFEHLRATADAIIVGAGTARAEGYGVAAVPLVVVSRRGDVPEQLRGAPAGSVLLATCGHAERLEEARAALGPDHVLVLGAHRVDLEALRRALVDRGWTRLLAEGGPHLLRDLLAAGVVDELCTTTVPRLIAGTHPRITDGPPVDVPLRLHTLLEQDGTILARWLT